MVFMGLPLVILIIMEFMEVLMRVPIIGQVILTMEMYMSPTN